MRQIDAVSFKGAMTAMDDNDDPASVRMFVAGKARLFLTKTGNINFDHYQFELISLDIFLNSGFTNAFIFLIMYYMTFSRTAVHSIIYSNKFTHCVRMLANSIVEINIT